MRRSVHPCSRRGKIEMVVPISTYSRVFDIPVSRYGPHPIFGPATGRPRDQVSTRLLRHGGRVWALRQRMIGGYRRSWRALVVRHHLSEGLSLISGLILQHCPKRRRHFLLLLHCRLKKRNDFILFLSGHIVQRGLAIVILRIHVRTLGDECFYLLPVIPPRCIPQGVVQRFVRPSCSEQQTRKQRYSKTICFNMVASPFCNALSNKCLAYPSDHAQQQDKPEAGRVLCGGMMNSN